MEIHVVQPGETIDSIANRYNIPVNILIRENGLEFDNINNLVIGQTIIIAYPKSIDTVQEGDTLSSIAERNQITLMELLRNNPFLSEMDSIYPGEVLVIQYQTNRIRPIATIGYALPYITSNILKQTLPYLTYLSILNYQITIEGEVIGTDDTEIVQVAKAYGVAPLMFVSTMASVGFSTSDIVYSIINNPQVQNRAISQILQILKSKNYYGINIYVEDITLDNFIDQVNLFARVAALYHSEGFKVFVTIAPIINIDNLPIRFSQLDYSKFAVSADAIIFATYERGVAYGCPSSITPVNQWDEFLDFVTKLVPSDKIFVGLIPFGYDWPIPYVPGYTRANAITSNGAIQIAGEKGVPIEYNEIAKAPYFFYYGYDDFHLLWFKDARSFNAIVELVPKHVLQGVTIWTIMNFNTQMWFVINLQYELEKITDPFYFS
ncbi:germination protein [Anaerocolumna cellulosilytica]|uniref:Germination protein n=1 Tax=Anaerocolumna cellulosilytica TaxID=433286 RepID=A0A6S6R8P3_9FIRM|nr:LysM peptidoglycan-binding domain-containing protein [Anaerocolumna cellulosilytica]MBB5196571.1 spore germination protein [Anaerocolumna cellulosilytica]BCJ95672.1 germination protein [Anaerocolumna cellulosilytica]